MTSVERILNRIINRGLEYYGRYYSKYRGFVWDREDPLRLSRLILVIPEITGHKPLKTWAWPTNNYSGEGFGSQVIPDKGDLVWVEFEHGNPRRPLWSHGYFGNNKDGLPEKPEELNDYDNFWFKTPKGHLIEFDDTNELIRITSISGKIIEIDKEGNIHLGKSGGADEAAALGDTLKARLDSLFDILLSAKTMTALGPQPFMPDDITALQNLKNQLPDILSGTITLDS